ncbi:MAG TPA: EamA family transporter [Tepidisphaeraceae bacterium]|nr:EamA family transporter [Tepidisphaeraceae bacterium]
MRWFLNSYFQIGLGALLVTASELLMKVGATAQHGNIGVFGIAALGSIDTWIGIILYCVSFASWIYVLRSVPLGIAYSLINIVHVLIPLGCWIFLGEVIPPQRWVGIALVLAGLLLVIQPVAAVERKLEKPA